MHKTVSILSLGALVLGICAPIGAAQSASKPIEVAPKAAPTAAQDRGIAQLHNVPARASKIIGTALIDMSGKEVAEIQDLVLTGTGELVVLVEREDNLFVGVPLADLEPRMTKSDLPEAKAKERMDREATGETPVVKHFALKRDRKLFDAAPTVADRKLVDGAWLVRSMDHFAGRKAAETKAATVATKKPAFLQALLGQDAKSTNGVHVCDIADVAIDLDDCHVAYAIVSIGGVLGMGDSLHAIAFDTLQLNDGSVTISTTKDNVSALAKLDLEHLPSDPTLGPALKTALPTAPETGSKGG